MNDQGIIDCLETITEKLSELIDELTVVNLNLKFIDATLTELIPPNETDRHKPDDRPSNNRP